MSAVNRIIEQDLVLGTLSREAVECYADNKNVAALSCLFLLMEHSIKRGLAVDDGNFAKSINDAYNQKLISIVEYKMLEELRELRNKMFHENHYAWALEIDGVAYFFSEDSTKRLLFTHFAEDCFETALKLMSV